MGVVREAVLAIREAVQDNGDEHTFIGRPAQLDQVKWLGELLGFTWPQHYLDILAAHDGVTVQQARIPSFFEAFRIFVVYREPWQKLQFWPIAEDGCGDYWVLPLKEQQDGDCPVYFLDHETDTGMAAPDRVVADSISDFVINYMHSLSAQDEAS